MGERRRNVALNDSMFIRLEMRTLGSTSATPRHANYASCETQRRDKVYQQNKRLSWALQEFSKRVFDFLPDIQSVILVGRGARGQLTKTRDVDLLVHRRGKIG
jgi:hypothetical protein